MGLTKFPRGVSSMGSPVGTARFSNPWATHYFVDGTNGSDNNNGKDPSSAVATIQKAVDLSATSAGDVIYIRPKVYNMATGFTRYEEDVVVAAGGTAGSGQTATGANRSLIGITPRTAGCPSDFTGVRWKYATNTNLNIEAPGTHIENIGFFSEDGTYSIYLESNGITWSKEPSGSSIYNCAIKGKTLYNDGGDGIQIVGCTFQCKYDGSGAPLIQMVGSANAVRRPVIRDCHFIGGNSTAASDAYIAMSAPIYDAVIRDCFFGEDPTGSDYIDIQGTANTSGIVANCFFASADIAAALNGIESRAAFTGVACYDTVGIEDLSD